MRLGALGSLHLLLLHLSRIFFSVVKISLKRILSRTILSTLISSSMSPAASLPAERGSVREASSAVAQVRLACPGAPGSQTPA